MKMKGMMKTTGPYDSLREYIAALEARGKVLRVKKLIRTIMKVRHSCFG